MYIKKIAVKAIPVKVVKLIKAPIKAPFIKKETKPEMFSKAWEWDQFCNHCID